MNDDTIFVIVFLFLLAWFFTPTPTQSAKEVSAYYAYCSKEPYNVYSCPNSESVRTMKIDYMVDYERQRVITKSLLLDMGKCLVYDEENWSCKNEYSVTEMHDGEIWDSNHPSRTIDSNGRESMFPHYMPISAIEYYVRYTKSAITSLRDNIESLFK